MKTFTQLVLESRQRIHDLRTREGVIITDVTQDGIRWTSENLISIAQGAVQELLRTLRALKLDAYINEASQTRFVNVVFDVTQTLSGLPGNFLKILGLQEIDDLQKIYSYVPPTEFFSKRYWYADVDDLYDIEGAVYTIAFHETDEENKVYFLPYVSEEKTGQATIHVGFDAFLTTDSTENIPLLQVDDLMLDYVEREVRRREANPVMVQQIEAGIANKLGEIALEKQRSN